MFGENDLEKLFFGAHLKVIPELCLRLRHRKSRCQLCLENCPCEAISIDESLQVRSSLCRGCGICVNVCPTGVFELRHHSYKSLLGQAGRRNTVEFSCSGLQQDETVINVPCLGYLNEAVLIGIITVNQPIRLKAGYCKKCRFAIAEGVIAKSLRSATEILSRFGISQKIITLVDPASINNRLVEGDNHYSRREFFSYLWKEMQGRWATATESDEGDLKTGVRTKVTLEPRLPPKRALLLENIKKLGQPVSPQMNAALLPFARVEINDNCSGCGMCATFCPTGALKSYSQEGKQVIDFAAAYCLACQLCFDICPENAIVYAVDVNAWDVVTEGRRTLAEREKISLREVWKGAIKVGDVT